MKLEKLKNNHKKKIIIGGLITLGIVGALIINTSLAKYKVTKSVKLGEGIVNFTASDLNLVSMYLVSSGGATTPTDTVPTSGYTFDGTKSGCKVNGVKDSSVTISYENGKVNVSNLTQKGTKCTFYFNVIVDTDKPIITSVSKTSTEKTSITVSVSASDTVTGGGTGSITKYEYSIDNGAYVVGTGSTHTFSGLTAGTSHTIKVRVTDASGNTSAEWSGSFSTEGDIVAASDRATQLVGASNISTARNGAITTSTEMVNTKLYSVADGMYGGTSYVYSGTNPNNWVSFAGFYWRIIRINGDGSIRLIYNGTSATTTGTGTQIGTKAYNTNYYDNAYVGFMYGTAGSSTYAATHTNTYNSTILGKSDGSESGTLNWWYKNNIANKGANITSKIDANGIFCNDRKVDKTANSGYQEDGYGINNTGYAPWGRLYTNGSWKSSQTPSLSCSQSNDIFSVSGAIKGNKKLTYPVALITSDEVVLAGGFGYTDRTFWLNTGQQYWTISPSSGGLTSADVFFVTMNGRLSSRRSDNENGVRPVINLRSDVKLTGSGTADSPYEVV